MEIRTGGMSYGGWGMRILELKVADQDDADKAAQKFTSPRQHASSQISLSPMPTGRIHLNYGFW